MQINQRTLSDTEAAQLMIVPCLFNCLLKIDCSCINEGAKEEFYKLGIVSVSTSKSIWGVKGG